jgi:hypothetical protein
LPILLPVLVLQREILLPCSCSLIIVNVCK